MLKFLATLALVMMLGVPAAADDNSTLNTSASVFVIDKILIQSVKGLNFGNLVPPTRATAIWYLLQEQDGLLLMGNGSDSFEQNPLSHHRGEFLILGHKDAAISFSLSLTQDFNAVGWELLNLKTFPASPASLSNVGTLTIYIGGRLKLATGAATGVNGGGQPAEITINVNYQ